MKLFFAIIFFYSVVTTGAGQTFENTVHLSSSAKPVRTFDHCFAIASGESVMYAWELMKTDSFGNPLWTQHYTISNYVWDGIYSLSQTADSGFIMIGTGTDSSSQVRLSAFIKTDKDGNLVFMKTYHQPFPNEFVIDNVIPAIGQGYILQGTSVNPSTPPRHIIVKTDSGGDTLWVLAIPLCSAENANIVATLDNNYITSTRNEVMGGNMLIKFDDNGNIIWVKAFGVYDTDNINQIVETADHGFILTGACNSNGAISSTYVIKTDVDGNVSWSRTFSQPVIFQFYGTAIAQTHDGGFILQGGTRDTGNQVTYLVRMDSSGDTLWGKLYNSRNIDGNVFPMADGGFYFVSATGGHYDMFIARTDNSGNTCAINTAANFTVGSPLYQTTTTTISTEPADILTATRLATSASIIEISTNLCFSTSASENTEHGDIISISPNPFHDSAVLTFSTGLQLFNVTLHIFDNTGRELSKVPVSSHTVQIERGNLPSGAYVYNIMDGSKVVNRGKILIE